ncbi:MAG: hypothetical protein A3I68_03380 [Candidatus Melainabacteria bacterium RIFCSPLOWO2_02_FULL_35_15]|nr:MAG: hypothetical protein A3F80_03700 [Candidatus Melainabacteria bacterium RIFCSPLOWO2_12_FULL_35_11]OGI14645.1 MAG: hypothetical protein A3I68_03380 [Candidatus Melainabacteria bacterium RIFCSPLOWO2_02_FULL_35_15]
MKLKVQYKIKNIAIIGLGLIGGSIAKALKIKGYKIIGITKNPKTIRLALKEKAINKGYTKLNSQSLENIDLIFICTPLHLITTYLNKISKLKLKKGVIITDVGSTKSEICNHAKKIFSVLHSTFRISHFFIGGHPMAGTEKSGFSAAQKDLFKNCAWILTPANKNNRLLTAIKTVVKKTGAKPIIINPEKHDKAVALVSHLPLLASIGLCQTVKESNFRELASTVASGGFRDSTRIAGGNPGMNSNLLISNLPILKKLLPVYIKELNNIIRMANTKSKNLHKKLNTVSRWRNSLYNPKGKNIY